VQVELQAHDEQQQRDAEPGEQLDLPTLHNPAQAAGPRRIPTAMKATISGWRSSSAPAPATAATPRMAAI